MYIFFDKKYLSEADKNLGLHMRNLLPYFNVQEFMLWLDNGRQ